MAAERIFKLGLTLHWAIDRKELRLVHSLARELCQKHYEFGAFKRYLRSNNIDLTNKIILDVGCGSAYSSQIIMQEFQPKELFAFDVVREEIELAKQRGLSANLFVASAANIPLRAEKFDAVFAIDVVHHIAQWRIVLKEMNRVLKCGGVLLIHEPRKKTLDSLERFLKVHHPVESRFEWPELWDGLTESGFHVVEMRNLYLGLFLSCLCIKEREIG